MKFLIVVLILATVLIAGCTQISSVVCKPNWIRLTSPINAEDVKTSNMNADELCKTSCYNTYKITSHKLEIPYEATCSSLNKTQCNFYYCYCDVNNCNP